MPLIHGRSKEAFHQNLKAEMKAGKPMKQSLAIAYAMKKRPKKMALGGEMESGYGDEPREHEVDNEEADQEDEMAYAHGDIVDHILRKRMSEGGRVANDTSPIADSRPNQFDDLVLRDDLESSYGEDDNSGDALSNKREEEDRQDIISRIMRQRSMRERNPRPA